MKLHDAGHRARELSRLSVELGREIADAADRPVVVAASVGPTGEILEPVGSLSHADCVEIFLDQAIGLKEGGADVYGWKPFHHQKNTAPRPRHFRMWICHGLAR